MSIDGRDLVTITIGLGLLGAAIVLRSVETAMGAAGLAGAQSIARPPDRRPHDDQT